MQPGRPADKVKLSGDGIKPEVLASMPVQFTIDTREAGPPKEVDVVIQVSSNWVNMPYIDSLLCDRLIQKSPIPKIFWAVLIKKLFYLGSSSSLLVQTYIVNKYKNTFLLTVKGLGRTANQQFLRIVLSKLFG